MKPMDDVRVRRALAHALNLKEIVGRIGPLLKSFPSALPSCIFGATDEFWTYDYDLKKAKRLLAEAGYPNGFELRMIYKKTSLYEPIALEVQNSWRDIVDVKLELIDKAVFTKTFKKYNHHIGVWAKARYVPHLYAVSYLANGPKNMSQYSNPKVDEVINKARSAATAEDSKKHWGEFQKLVTEDVANLWPAVGSSITAVRDNVKGVVLMPFTGVFDFERVRNES